MVARLPIVSAHPITKRNELLVPSGSLVLLLIVIRNDVAGFGIGTDKRTMPSAPIIGGGAS